MTTNEDGRWGQVVLVGATGAMGSAITERLVSRQVPVLAVARSQDELGKLAPSSDLVSRCVADIADDSSIEIISNRLDSPVRMAILAVGLPVRGSADTIEPAALAAGFNVKVGGMVRLVQAVRDRLQPGSRLVAIAGTLGLEPRAHEAGPGTVNAAMFNLMRQLSQLYGPRGVTTHTLAPGPADTPRLRRIVTAVAEERGVGFDQVWQEYLDQNSLRRLPTVAEVAWAVTLLLDEEADVLHGGVLHLDAGGMRGIG